MKFISKASNYRVVLRHGLPAEPMTGRAAVAGIYIKFEDGVARVPANGVGGVSYDEIVEMLKKHDTFGKDFLLVEDNDKDPYGAVRKQKEPEHSIIELEHGAVVGTINARNARTRMQSDPKQREMIMDIAKEMAVKIASDMAPKLAQDLLKKMVAEKQEEEHVLRNQKGEEVSGDAEVPMSYDEAHSEESKESDDSLSEGTVTEDMLSDVTVSGTTAPESEPKKKGRPRKSILD